MTGMTRKLMPQKSYDRPFEVIPSGVKIYGPQFRYILELRK